MSDLVGKSLKNTSRCFLSCFALAYASPGMADASPEAQEGQRGPAFLNSSVSCRHLKQGQVFPGVHLLALPVWAGSCGNTAILSKQVLALLCREDLVSKGTLGTNEQVTLSGLCIYFLSAIPDPSGSISQLEKRAFYHGSGLSLVLLCSGHCFRRCRLMSGTQGPDV